MVKILTQAAIASRFDILGMKEPSEIARHAEYLDLLRHWNKTVNLTSLCLDPLSAEAIDRLIIEPVVAARHIERSKNLADIGTGGGSPALPLAVESSAQSLTMIESRTRKCAFLREASRVLEVSANVVEARFEQALREAVIQATSDYVTIRAVRLDIEAGELIRYLLRDGGTVLRFTSTSRDESIVPEGFHVVSDLPLLPSQQSHLQFLIVS